MRQNMSIEIFNYWDAIRGAHDAPLRSQIEPASVRHILPRLFILEMTEDSQPRFRLAGTMVCNLFNRELRDENFACLWGGSQPNDAVKIAQGVMQHAVPALINATGYTATDRAASFEVVLLPVRSSAETCDRLLGCLVPSTSAAWLGADPLTTLTLDRSRLLHDWRGSSDDTPPAPKVARSLLVSKGTDIGDALRRVLHLKVFDGGRAR